MISVPHSGLNHRERVVAPKPRSHLSVNNLSVDKNFSDAARRSKAVVRQKDGRQKDSRNKLH